MSAAEKIFYACATIEMDDVPDSLCKNAMHNLRQGIAHFYIKAEDEVVAGSHIFTMCQDANLKFGNYVYLPVEEHESTVHSLNEHRAAFSLAEREGEAIVLSFVLNHEQNSMDLNCE